MDWTRSPNHQYVLVDEFVAMVPTSEEVQDDRATVGWCKGGPVKVAACCVFVGEVNEDGKISHGTLCLVPVHSYH